MSLWRHAAKRDRNEPEIIDALESFSKDQCHGGIKVYQLRSPVDLLVCYNGLFILMEVKDGKGRLTESQEKFIKDNPLGPLYVVRNGLEAIAACRDAMVQWMQRGGT